jgi:hypothetical protein
MKIDLNELGRVLYKLNYDKEKLKLTFDETSKLQNEIIDKIIDDVVNIKNSQFFDKQSLINVLKNNLLLLYISNINLNDFIGVETT